VVYYKYVEKPKKEYSITIVADARAGALKARIKELMAREFDHGGPNDLEKSMIRSYDSLAKFTEAMNSERGGGETSENDHPMLDSSPATIEDGVLALSDLDGENTSETTTVTGTSTDLDNLDLAALEPITETKVVKTVTLDAKTYAEKFKDANWRKTVFDLMVKHKKISFNENQNIMHKSCYDALKVESLTVPETDVTIPF